MSEQIRSSAEYNRRAIIEGLRAGHSQIIRFFGYPKPTVYDVAAKFFASKNSTEGSANSTKKRHSKEKAVRTPEIIAKTQQYISEDPGQSLTKVAKTLDILCIDSLQIRVNRMLLLAVGLWPYQQSKLVQFQLIPFFTILTSFIIFQFTAFLTSKCTLDLLINVLSSILFYTLFVVKYSWFHINIEDVKCLLEQLQNSYKKLTDENEISIIKKYSSYAKRYTAGLILILTFMGPVIIYEFCPKFFDILLSINESRRFSPRKIIVTEYFINQKKYLYLILLHANTALLIGIIALLATGTILIVYLQYACGMFRIACYRIEQSMAVDALRKGSLRNKNLTFQKLICAVNMHREAMKFSNSSISRFKVMFSFMIVIGLVSGCLSFFRLFQGLSLGHDVEEIMLPLTSCLIYLMYLFLGNYIAQEIMDHNNDVFITAYSIQWYTASLKVQKMILFLLQRSTKVFNLNIAGFFVGSLETAAAIFSTELSYFTVLYSIQN
ncbi:uncharacterized protein [Anoplolepis gracilipes]|uniref:uncharacterized protein n=1 Tax=Anoplolepis gracilipes TaxID=354296 RepID=UPI003B9E3A70